MERTRSARLGDLKRPIEVGVLGATGAVGQRFMQLLANHPWFRVVEVYASERSIGRRYADATNWRLSADIPEGVADLTVRGIEPGKGTKVIFLAASAPDIGEIEENLAAAGHIVISNASAHRMDGDVPLLIPEVNPYHLQLLDMQRRRRGGDGRIVTNPNCSTVGLAIVLKPLHDAFGIEAVDVTTLQAASGAGYPGVSSMDLIDSLVPFIRGEEDKIETETLKLLGKLCGDAVLDAGIRIDASCNRVPVRDGHMETVGIIFVNKPDLGDVREALATFQPFLDGPYLPSAPAHPIICRDEEDRPQPVLDRDSGKGMAVTVGRIRLGKVTDTRLTLLSHNTIRGAAGGAIENAELMTALGHI